MKSYLSLIPAYAESQKVVDNYVNGTIRTSSVS